jgi:hypothetical protein
MMVVEMRGYNTSWSSDAAQQEVVSAPDQRLLEYMIERALEKLNWDSKMAVSRVSIPGL